jgi:hypothetical protein
MHELTGIEILTRFEKVLIDNLGEVGKYLLEQQLKQCQISREKFSSEKVDILLSCIKNEFSKVIGYGVEKLEVDLRRAIRGDQNV